MVHRTCLINGNIDYSDNSDFAKVNKLQYTQAHEPGRGGDGGEGRGEALIAERSGRSHEHKREVHHRELEKDENCEASGGPAGLAAGRRETRVYDEEERGLRRMYIILR